MPTLVLPPRYTEDTNRVRKAAMDAGWDVERLIGWRAPDWLREKAPVLYGEPLFAAVVADSLGLALREAPFDWLTTVPRELVRREMRFMTLGEARNAGRAFFKPADDKCFAARVYESGIELPDSSVLPDSTPVLVSEPVKWSIEFRCFVLQNQLMTLSPYLRDRQLCRAADGSWPASDDEVHAATEFIQQVLSDSRIEIPPAHYWSLNSVLVLSECFITEGSLRDELHGATQHVSQQAIETRISTGVPRAFYVFIL